jgi:hypothetical protein
MRLSLSSLPPLGVALLLGSCAGAPPPVEDPASPALQAKAAAGRSAAAIAAPDLHATVGRLTSRTGADRVETVRADGVHVVTFSQGFSQVVLARTNPDGSVTTKCVDSEQASRDFLGGAGATSQPSQPARSNQR